MSDTALSGHLAAAAAMVLLPPDEKLLAILAETHHTKIDLLRASRDFYDTLCVPQSGHYVPPYAHVLAKMRQIKGYYNFPPARYDGGDALRAWYDAIDFEPLSLDVDPMNQGPHRPLDHIGFVLTFLSELADAAESSEVAGEIAVGFTTEHFGHWVDCYVDMLSRSDSPYIGFVAEALAEAVAAVRKNFPREDSPSPKEVGSDTNLSAV